MEWVEEGEEGGDREEEEEAAPVDLSAIEVEKKGKEKNTEEGAEVPAEEVKE